MKKPLDGSRRTHHWPAKARKPTTTGPSTAHEVHDRRSPEDVRFELRTVPEGPMGTELERGESGGVDGI